MTNCHCKLSVWFVLTKLSEQYLCLYNSIVFLYKNYITNLLSFLFTKKQEITQLISSGETVRCLPVCAGTLNHPPHFVSVHNGALNQEFISSYRRNTKETSVCTTALNHMPYFVFVCAETLHHHLISFLFVIKYSPIHYVSRAIGKLRTLCFYWSIKSHGSFLVPREN